MNIWLGYKFNYKYSYNEHSQFRKLYVCLIILIG